MSHRFPSQPPGSRCHVVAHPTRSGIRTGRGAGYRSACPVAWPAMSAATVRNPWPGRRPAPALIWAITLTGITANTLIAPVLPDIVEDFGRSDGAAGPLVAAASLPGVFLAPVIGLLADRFGRRNVVVPCLGILGIAGVVSTLAPSYWVLVGARLGMGIGIAGLINLAVVLIGDHWDGSERVRQVGRNAAVLTAGLALLPLLSGTLAAIGGWRLPWRLRPWRCSPPQPPGSSSMTSVPRTRTWT